MPAKRGSTPKRHAPPLPHVLNVRLDDTLRRYLLYLSARDGIGQGEIVRRILERSLDAQPRVLLEGEHELPEDVRADGLPLRTVLGMITEEGIDALVAEQRGRASS